MCRLFPYGCKALESVFVQGDNVVLAVEIELDEISRITGDANHQITIRLGIGLGGAQRLRVDDVVLDLQSAVFKIRLRQV